MENDNVIQYDSIWNEESFNFDDLQSNLESQLEENLSDLSDLELEFDKVANPEALGDTISTVVWEQFINQIGVIAGEEFIKENKGVTLDLRNSAHIQTTENFQKGKIATHNQEINFQERYDNWQLKFEKDELGNVKMHSTRYGVQEENLAKGAREIFDKGRQAGSKEKGIDMDHTVSVGELIRNPSVNTHLSESEQVDFANGSKNLYEMDSSHNRSKKDSPMKDWLDNPNKNGQKPNEIFDIDQNLDKEYREKDKIAREELDKRIKEGETKTISSGKKSQKEEAFRIGGKALQAVLMGLLAVLVKKIIQKLISWFASGKKNFKEFLANLKEVIFEFTRDLKQHLVNAADTLLTSIATAIFGPIINMVKKAWMFLKQGYKSVKEAIAYIKNPQNKGKSMSVLMLEVGKIVIAGLTVGGALLLGEVIEKALLTIPGLGFPIPLLGSLASILGIFFGAISSGILGALALNLIDKMIANKKRSLLTEAKIEKGNQILEVQDKLKKVVSCNLDKTKNQFASNVYNRHTALGKSFKSLEENNNTIDIERTKNDNDIDELFNLLNS